MNGSTSSSIKKSTGKAAILAVGTELTTGQIINRNSAWLSEKLTNIGIEVEIHETVADDRQDILDSLQSLSARVQFIFVTGGLGPTTDDFTREVVADFLKQRLIFHPSSWQHIENRLSRLGIRVADSNRQQAYFPEDSIILPNSQGTAAGFFCRLPSENISYPKTLWVLPGPPAEIAAIWKDNQVEHTLIELFPSPGKQKLFTWQCIGKSEAELGEITEKALSGSGLKTGYRAHRPYVEIKVWCPENDLKKLSPWIDQLEKAIQPWILTRQGEDLGQVLLEKLRAYDSVEIFDSATGGVLAQRMGSLLRKQPNTGTNPDFTCVSDWNRFQDHENWVKEILTHATESNIALALGGFSLNAEFVIGMKESGQIRTHKVQAPYLKLELLERNQGYSCEIALKTWSDWLSPKSSLLN